MARSEFDELMKRYVTGKVTEAERARIEAWLDAMKDNDVSDLELSQEEQDALYQKIVSKEENIRAIQGFRPESLRRKNRQRWTLRLAAGFFIAFSISFVIIKIVGGNDPELHRLQDGTLVWLQPDSKFSYWEADGKRFGRLEGEGLFEVAKDAHRPFTIDAGGASIRVVGTSFNIRTGEKLEVMVLTGTVKVSSATDTVGVTLTGNMQLVYDPNAGFVTGSVAQKDLDKITRHTEYVMQFSNEPFSEVITRLEKKFDVSIDVKSASVKQCHVNIDLTDSSLKESLEKITAILNVEYSVTGRTVTLSGTGCQ